MAKNKYDSLFKYPVGDNKNFTNIVKQATSRLGKMPKKSYKALEEYLQGIFYPETIKHITTSQQKINKIIQSSMSEYLSNILQKTIENYEFDLNKISGIKRTDQVIPIKQYESFSHKQYIQIETLERRMQAAQEALVNLSIQDFELQTYDKLVQNLQDIIDICNKLISQNELHTKSSNEIPIIKLDKDTSLFEMIKILDEKFHTVSYLYDMPIPNWLLGEIFEKSLDLAFSLIDIENMATNLVEEKIKEIMTKKTAGAATTSRGKLTVGIKGYEIVDEVERKNKDGEITGFDYIIKSPTTNHTFKINGVFSNKQQKMDIELNFKDNVSNEILSGKNFRTSAKNWTTLSGHDFGETDLQGAILRSSTLVDAIAFGLQLGYIGYNKESNLTYETQLHHFARINLLLDIVMGYSQESGYANVLIINDRAMKRIRVYSIRSILDSLKDDIELLSKSSNYNEEQVKETLVKSGIDWTDRLNIQEYENLLLNALKKMKFNINTQILNEENLT